MGCGSSVQAPSASTPRPRALSSEDSLDEVYNSRSRYVPTVWKEDPNQDSSARNEPEKAPSLRINNARIVEEPEEKQRLLDGAESSSSLPAIKSALPKPHKSTSSDSLIYTERQLSVREHMRDPFIPSVSPRIPAPHVAQPFARARSSSALSPLSASTGNPSPRSSLALSEDSESPRSSRNHLTRSTPSNNGTPRSGPPVTPTFTAPQGLKRRSQSMSSSVNRSTASSASFTSSSSSSSASPLAPIAHTAPFSSPSKHLPSPFLHPTSSAHTLPYYDRLESIPHSSALIQSPAGSRSPSFTAKSATLNLHVNTDDSRASRVPPRLAQSSDTLSSLSSSQARTSISAQTPVTALPPSPAHNSLKHGLSRKLSEPTLSPSHRISSFSKREGPLPSPVSPSVIIPDMQLESPSDDPGYSVQEALLPPKDTAMQKAPSGLTEAMARLQRLLEQRDTRKDLLERGILRSSKEDLFNPGTQQQIGTFLASRNPPAELQRRGIL